MAEVLKIGERMLARNISERNDYILKFQQMAKEMGSLASLLAVVIIQNADILKK